MGDRYELPLFPLNTVLFPGMVLPLHVFEDRYKDMMQRCLSNAEPFGVVLLKAGRPEGVLGDIYDVGTLAEITQVKRLDGDRLNIVSVGSERFKLHETHRNNLYLTGIVEDFPLEGQDSAQSYQLSKKLMTSLANYLRRFKKLGKINLDIQSFPEDPASLAFLTAMLLPITNEEKQELLSIAEAVTLLQKERHLLQHEAHILQILLNEQPVQQNSNSPFSKN